MLNGTLKMGQENAVISKIRDMAIATPDAVALVGIQHTLTYQQLIEQVDTYATYFSGISATSIAVDLDNGPEWAILDLALLLAGKVAIPIPHFFSKQQIGHLISDGGVELLLTQTPDNYKTVDSYCTSPFQLCGSNIHPIYINQPAAAVPTGTVKVTYTSGTTSTPKGVCIAEQAIETTVKSIAQRAAVTHLDHHLSVLPLTTLLENLGGLYAALISGATVTLLPQPILGINGSSGIDPTRFIEQFEKSAATTSILIPQMVDLMVNAVESGKGEKLKLRYAAVGGAPTSNKLLERANQLALGIHEGYGLSEATSVVAVNAPGKNSIGTVGKPLPHIQIKIESDGELSVKGSLFNGYIGQENAALDADGFLPTGDLAELNKDGNLILKGRKKSLITTAFGRNIAPEWVEQELIIQPGILQAALFGDGRPWNVAVIVSHPDTDVRQAIKRVNQSLPDYARIQKWIDAETPFSIENKQWTGTARPRREAIWSHYGKQIEALYTTSINEFETDNKEMTA